MICSHCKTPNLSDYKYCRECGTRLGLPTSGSAADAADAEVEPLLAAAFTALEHDDRDEALAKAQSAVGRRPDSPAAHSSLGAVCEKLGRPAEAAEEFRLALELNPGSVADREKLAALTGEVDRRLGGRRWKPARAGLALAVAAGVVLTGTGLMLLTHTGQQSDGRLGARPGGGARLQSARLPAPAGLTPNQAGQPPMGRFVGPPAPSAGAGRVAGSVAPPALLTAPPPGVAAAKPSREPLRRIGLPEVVDRPIVAPAAGLPTARVGRIVPLDDAQPAAGGRATWPPPNRTAAPAPAPPQYRGDVPPAPQLAGARQGAGTAAPARASAPVEPFEPDTGFIRLEPSAPGAPGVGEKAVGPPNTGPKPPARRPSISVSIGPASGRPDRPR